MGRAMSRVRPLNTVSSPSGDSVLYVMMRDQRIGDNHALAAAQAYSEKHELPLAVVFVLQRISGDVAREHYEFMLEGLKEIDQKLKQENIPFLFYVGRSSEILPTLINDHQPRALFFDFSPLRGPRRVRESMAKNRRVEVYEVDTHNSVPVWDAYPKQAIGARVLRPHIHAKIADYIEAPGLPTKQLRAWTGQLSPMSDHSTAIRQLLEDLQQNHTSHGYTSGESAAQEVLKSFIDERLLNYADDRNDPSKDGLSGLSPYLHYGQLSSIQVILAARQAVGEDERLRTGFDALFEEMLVRKDLSDNFCYYNSDYDKLSAAPAWAQATLHKHADDPREHVYSRAELEAGKTHDQSWNAAQRQLIQEGKIHGYMRMYWAKKVLEWSPSPHAALERLLYMNDFYHLDGRDPNGYVGILWSIAGVHDRPWREREVFGSVRYMVESGLRRKFDIDTYIAKYASDTH